MFKTIKTWSCYLAEIFEVEAHDESIPMLRPSNTSTSKVNRSAAESYRN